MGMLENGQAITRESLWNALDAAKKRGSLGRGVATALQNSILQGGAKGSGVTKNLADNIQTAQQETTTSTDTSQQTQKQEQQTAAKPVTVSDVANEFTGKVTDAQSDRLDASKGGSTDNLYVTVEGNESTAERTVSVRAGVANDGPIVNRTVTANQGETNQGLLARIRDAILIRLGLKSADQSTAVPADTLGRGDELTDSKGLDARDSRVDAQEVSQADLEAVGDKLVDFLRNENGEIEGVEVDTFLLQFSPIIRSLTPKQLEELIYAAVDRKLEAEETNVKDKAKVDIMAVVQELQVELSSMTADLSSRLIGKPAIVFEINANQEFSGLPGVTPGVLVNALKELGIDAHITVVGQNRAKLPTLFAKIKAALSRNKKRAVKNAANNNNGVAPIFGSSELQEAVSLGLTGEANSPIIADNGAKALLVIALAIAYHGSSITEDNAALLKDQYAKVAEYLEGTLKYQVVTEEITDANGNKKTITTRKFVIDQGLLADRLADLAIARSA